MKGYYQILETIKEQLQKDVMVNTVTSGNLFDVDLDKQTIFPLSHVMINNASYEGNIWRFNISVLCMDIVDDTDVNQDDVHHTQLMVANRLLEILNRGDLAYDLYQLDGTPNCEPFIDRFENKIAGWTCSFDVIVSNDMTIC